MGRNIPSMLFSSAGIALHLFEFEFHACKISFVLYVSSLKFLFLLLSYYTLLCTCMHILSCASYWVSYKCLYGSYACMQSSIIVQSKRRINISLPPLRIFFVALTRSTHFFCCCSICCLFRLVRRTVEWSRIGTQMVPGISVRSSNAYSCVYIFVTSFVFLLYTLSMHIFRFIWIIRRSMLRTRTVSRVCMCMHRVHYYILLLYDMCIDHLRS